MADVAYSDLSEHTAPEPDDLLGINHVSDTTADPAGTTKKVKVKNARGNFFASKSSNYTATTTDRNIFVDTSSGNVTITLPAAASSSGHILRIKKTVAANLLYIDGNASETIDGETQVEIANQYDCIEIQCDGSNWMVLAYYRAPNNKYMTISNAALGKGGSAPTQAVIGDYIVYKFGIGDDAVYVGELPHDIDLTQDLDVHISYIIEEAYATASAEVQWQVEYSLTPHDESEAIDSPGNSGTLTSGDLNIPATAKAVAHATGITIPASALTTTHDILGLTISRIALTGGTNPTAEPGILEVHIVYKRRPFVNDS